MSAGGRLAGAETALFAVYSVQNTGPNVLKLDPCLLKQLINLSSRIPKEACFSHNEDVALWSRRLLLKSKDEIDKQSSLSHFAVQKKMDNADPRFEEIDVAITQMIVVDDQFCFRVFENPGFINLIKRTMQTTVKTAQNVVSSHLRIRCFLPEEVTDVECRNAGINGQAYPRNLNSPGFSMVAQPLTLYLDLESARGSCLDSEDLNPTQKDKDHTFLKIIYESDVDGADGSRSRAEASTPSILELRLKQGGN
uniref:Uncharacterized protein n=1 Tax=Romanomermis culicivorax TaxID=13658 RepID=A0A915HM24_ROMCU